MGGAGNNEKLRLIETILLVGGVIGTFQGVLKVSQTLLVLFSLFLTATLFVYVYHLFGWVDTPILAKSLHILEIGSAFSFGGLIGVLWISSGDILGSVSYIGAIFSAGALGAILSVALVKGKI